MAVCCVIVMRACLVGEGLWRERERQRGVGRGRGKGARGRGQGLWGGNRERKRGVGDLPLSARRIAVLKYPSLIIVESAVRALTLVRGLCEDASLFPQAT